jgi:protein-tyrosine phosphatase
LAPTQIRSITNFRDVGGCSTRDGRRVRTGRLFRSGHLGGASAEDLERLGALGIRTVIDFRVPQDLADDGTSRLPPGARRLNIPMHDPAQGGDIRQLLYRADAVGLERVLGGGGAERLMCEAAAGLVTERCAEFGSFLRALSGEHPLPALMHCSAGKDRTGWAASLLLLVLGALEEDVIDHYLLSNEHRREENERLLASPREGLDPEWIRPFLEVRADYARASLAAATARFGSFGAYVEQGLGVEGGTVVRLRELFLE